MGATLTTVAVGHVTHDLVDGRVLPGGCAYYAARTFQALGAHSRLATSVGEDFACEDAFKNVEVLAEKTGTTTVFQNTYPDGGARVQYVRSQAPPVAPGNLDAAWGEADVLFVGPVLHETDLAAWCDTVEARWTAIGVQGFVRQAGAADSGQPDLRLVVPTPWVPEPDLLKRVDVACLSEEDLAGQGDLLARLRANVPIVALTRERAGCDIITEAGTRWVGIHTASVVDPTGAGDTFAAGFLYGLARGLDPIEAARLGAACASIIIEDVAGASLSRIPSAFERMGSVQQDRRRYNFQKS